MKSLTGKFASVRGWALLLALLLGAGIMISACGDEEVPTPTTPEPPTVPPPPAPEPDPEPEPEGPSAPAVVQVTNRGADFVEWTWSAVEGAIGYNVQFGPNPFLFTDTSPLPQNTSLTFFRASNLQANMTVHLRVRTVAGTLQEQELGEWSATFSGTTTAPPPAVPLSAPAGLEVTDREEDSITLAWDAVSGADHYEVEQSEDGAVWGDASCGGDDNEVDDEECAATGLAGGTAYEFRVRAIPASDDISRSESDWTETTSSVTTTGVGPVSTTPGGTGSLNVRWQNGVKLTDNSDIVFIWDRQGDATYEISPLLAAAMTEDDPCKDLTNTNYTNQGAATSLNVTTAVPGSVHGLCVRTTGGSEVSLAWGINPPEEPDVGTPEDEEGVTKELNWDDVNLVGGFDYEIRLAADPERPAGDNKIGDGSTAIAEAVQKACDAGTLVDELNPDISLGDLSVSVGSGLKPHTGYLLCVRASNSVGESAWAVPVATDTDSVTYGTGDVVEVFTRPAAPPRPQVVSSRTTPAANLANELVAPDWEIATRSANNVPRTAAAFELRVLTSNAASAANLNVAACGTAVDGYTVSSDLVGSAKDTLSGFELPGSRVQRLAFTIKVYLCVQANSGTDIGQGVGPWSISSVFNVSKPSTSLAASAVTHAAATLTITGWNKAWWHQTDAAGCTSVAAGTATDSLGSLTPSTLYRVRAWDDATCAANQLGGSISFRTAAAP